MKHEISTDTYKIQADTRLAIAAKNHQFFTLHDQNTQFERQAPMLNMALSEQADLMEAPELTGHTYTERLISYFKDKRYQIELADDLQSIEIAGQAAYRQKATSNISGLHIHHDFINIPLEDGFMLEISTDVEDKMRDIYEPIFYAAIHSLELLGNYAHYINLQNQAFEERMAKLQASIDKMNASIGSAPETPAPLTPPAYHRPQDDRERARIGEYRVSLSPESECSISAYAKALYIKLITRFEAHEQAQADGFLSCYPGTGIEFSLVVDRVFQQGQPYRQLSIIKDKTADNEHLRHEGLRRSSLHFYGDVILDGDWLALLGHLQDEYQQQVYPVELYKKIDSSDFEWKNYCFHLDEARQANKHDVSYLTIHDETLTEFPEDIFDFTQLRELRLCGRARAQWYDTQLAPLQIGPLPDRFDTLTKLEKLHIRHFDIDLLPESIAALTQLTHLTVHCPVRHVPARLFTHQKLEALSINGRLTSLPEHIDMPSLRRLNLRDNRLTTLPRCLLNLDLNALDIQGNPFESLPGEFKQMPIDLSYAEKCQYFDWQYQGADNTGIVHWKDSVFYASDDTALTSDMARDQHEFKTEIINLVKHAVTFHTVEEDDMSTVGAHRLGGMPDLPADLPYPRFGQHWRDDKEDFVYEFIAQLNCDALAPMQEYLPRTGMLFFFLSTHHDIDGGQYNRAARVIHVEDITTLSSGTRFHFEASDFFELPDTEYDSYYQPLRLQAVTRASLPALDTYTARNNPHLFSAALREQLAQHKALFDELNDRMHQDWGALAINRYSSWEQEHPELQACSQLGGAPQDWIILLQVDSVGDMMWGDAGELFFVIHKSDLARQDFSKVVATLSSH